MKPVSKSVSSATASGWIVLDTYANPFNVGFAVVLTGTATYTVQHTFDDPASSPTVFSHPTVAAQTANADGNYAFPVRAIRVNVTAYTSGTITLTAIQAG